jgi:energy-coupling factor transport system ATP-binding protein
VRCSHKKDRPHLFFANLRDKISSVEFVIMEALALIEVRNLVHSYKTGEGVTQEALRGVNMTVHDGEFLVILGHNGSGKSTLAKHLNGLLMPDAGDVVVDGMNTKDAEHFWEIRQRVGMVFQNPDNQLIATSVEEDTAFGPENLGVEPALIRQRVDQALKALGMFEYKQRAVHLLSGGQKQRVAIAGVMAMEPKVLVLDEPTAMLDPRGRKEVMEAVHRLNKEKGITVVHITHIMEEALDCDRILVMEDGQIVMEGKPKEIFRQADKLRALRLDVPHMVDLADQLRNEGVALPEDILTIEEMVVALCPSL